MFSSTFVAVVIMKVLVFFSVFIALCRSSSIIFNLHENPLFASIVDTLLTLLFFCVEYLRMLSLYVEVFDIHLKLSMKAYICALVSRYMFFSIFPNDRIRLKLSFLVRFCHYASHSFVRFKPVMLEDETHKEENRAIHRI